MRVFLSGLCLVFLWCSPAIASRPTSPQRLTVLLQFEQPPSAESLAALRSKTIDLLAGSGLTIDIQDRSSLDPHAEFENVVLFHMRGRCEMKSWPIGVLSDERGALAMAYTSDGELLPFGEVQCDRVRASLGRAQRHLTGDRLQSAYGSALGVVLAHELYHILGSVSKHTKAGITKESLSGTELLEGNLMLPPVALDAIRDRKR